MTPSEVSRDNRICRFITADNWDDVLQQPTPRAFRASDRQLSVFHVQRVQETGDSLQDLCIEQLSGAGEAHLSVSDCIELGQGISDRFDPRVYWRPEKTSELWERWKDIHSQIESSGGNAGFPVSYRSILAETATCPATRQTPHLPRIKGLSRTLSLTTGCYARLC